jgi:hypothetical protein
MDELCGPDRWAIEGGVGFFRLRWYMHDHLCPCMITSVQVYALLGS